MGKARKKKSRGNPRNNGKKLEQLVTLIESMNLPEGYKVEPNKKIFNSDGVQIAELDIVVSFTAGTLTYQTLFECRDRPSDGTAEVGWIEQLNTRRLSHNFSYVVAVSTTGFSPGAEDAAKKFNVYLRTVAQLTEEEIRGFLPQTAPMLLVWYDVKRFDLELIEDGVESLIQEDASKVEIRQLSLSGDCVLDLRTNERMAIKTLFHKVIDSGAADSQFPAIKSEATIVLTAEHFDNYRADVDGTRACIRQLKAQGQFQRGWSKMRLQSAVHYQGDGMGKKTIATWEGEPEMGFTKMQVILTKLS